MRQIPAMVLVLALLAAPLALLANGVSIARYEKQLSMTAVDEHCQQQAGMLGICGCHPGNAPVPVIISPLPEMLLPRPVQHPTLEIRKPEFRVLAVVIRAGFIPTPFHPPRG